MSGDSERMRQALDLAEQGRGRVEPNPLVGAVVVRDGRVVGTGWHQRFGEAHAEVHALREAGAAARGATLLVTLEPCCHHGKTPPCAEAILQAGIARVVAAMRDPFPRVAGGGFDRLRAQGVAVEVGVCEEEARRLNAPYLTLLGQGRPYVHAKWAMTLDGKIATRTGDSKWISGEESRGRAHQLRGRMDGILVGIGTALADDPHLTVRPPGPRTPTRVVLDSKGRLPTGSYLARSARATPTLVATTAASAPGWAAALGEAGCEVVAVGAGADGRVSVSELLAGLGQRRWTNVLVEGGSEVLGAFLDAGMIDEVHVFIAPRLAGGAGARTAVGGVGVGRIAESLRLARVEVESCGQDVLVHGWAR